MVLACSAGHANNGSHAPGTAVIVFLFLFLGGYVIGFAPIPLLYVNEIWPTDLRAKGTSIYWISQTVALCFNQSVNPIAPREIQWKYYFVYTGVLVVVIAFIFFYVPETKGLSLEEDGRIFDRQYADVVAHSTDIASGKMEGPSVTLVDEVAQYVDFKSGSKVARWDRWYLMPARCSVHIFDVTTLKKYGRRKPDRRGMENMDNLPGSAGTLPK